MVKRIIRRHTQRAFAGIPEDATSLMPTIPGDASLQGGIPQFFDGFSNEPYSADLFDWMDEGRVEVPVLGIFGKRNKGKTTFCQVCAYRNGTRDINDEYALRVSAENHRGRRGIPEWQRFAQLTGTDLRTLRKVRMNLLDMKLPFTMGQQLQVVRNKIQLSSQQKLKPRHAEALKYGIMKVRDLFPERADISMLILGLRTMSKREIRILDWYYSSKLHEPHQNDPAYKMMVGLKTHYTKEILQACWELAGMLDELMNGMFGDLFGGSLSIADDFAKQYYIKDYAGMSDIEIALMQSLYWEIKTAAVVNDKLDLLHDIEFCDEFHRMVNKDDFALPMLTWLKTIRDTSTAVVLASHRFGDFRTELGRQILEEISAFLLLEHTINSSYETAERIGLNETERKSLLSMPMGHAGLKFANTDEPMHMVKTDLTEIEQWMVESNQANKRKAKRRVLQPA